MKGHFMEKLNDILNTFDGKNTNRTKGQKKRKWREIEQLKEKFQLEKELRLYDDSLEYMLEDY